MCHVSEETIEINEQRAALKTGREGSRDCLLSNGALQQHLTFSFNKVTYVSGTVLERC